ncbi:MAG: hypothetical protein JWM19_7169 [Actinomycetia bacterium]|nr:hypothetical protein [Actinomycetes bacterium]
MMKPATTAGRLQAWNAWIVCAAKRREAATRANS